MKFIQLFSIFVLVALVIAAFVPHETEAGKKKMLKKAALAALLLKGGKKILLPLPIPIPIPILKQTQPVYYPSYPSYGGHY
ncbi:hypothetical protein GZH46_00859 [Fragariocoptes setiger]|uniref:Uncharacterized protein n=1 Tax=Fragariocoptes setiger TaxID=1670756 RepID=A0ABQ7SB24_9ACAR|nr:hypothetical protein GZH46_00859 [Fragariocoptes setiger]